MRVLSVVGARPQFVKAAAFSRACAHAGVTETIVHTGQHYDSTLSELFFRDLQIPEPWRNLGIGSSSHATQIAGMMVGLEAAIADLGEPLDLVVVFGDTNSTLAAGITAVKNGLRLVHAEAGLRSFNRRMPEEVNRVMVDRISCILFCPNQTAVDNLSAEGINDGVHLVGDLMFDALRLFAPVARRKYDPVDVSGISGRYGLVTIHRAENTLSQAKLARVVDCLSIVDMPLVWPMHPGTVSRLSEFGISLPDQVTVLEPVGYLAMLSLIAGAEMVLTDSGGVQREAYWLHRPCITLREETEWLETLDGGWNQLVGSDTFAMATALQKRPTGQPDALPETFAGEEMIRILLEVN